MENEEINRLRQLKADLLEKMNLLKDSLKRQEENGHQSSFNFNVMLPSDDENQKPSTELLSNNYKVKLSKISSHITGITFKDVDKKWFHDDIYIYTAKVETKTITFILELKVDFKDINSFRIDSIMCYFIDVNNCYMLEISSWFEQITNIKNFSLLMSALSDYNENNILRSKILHSLESKKYANFEFYSQESGGILVHIHSPLNTRKNYMIFHWTLKFLELTWHIEHYFTVEPTDTGMEFSEQNSSLLEDFCKINLTKNSLVELWNRLCTAIDTYHAKR